MSLRAAGGTRAGEDGRDAERLRMPSIETGWDGTRSIGMSGQDDVLF